MPDFGTVRVDHFQSDRVTPKEVPFLRRSLEGRWHIGPEEDGPEPPIDPDARVVPATGETMNRSSPKSRFRNDDFPTLGRPTSATFCRQESGEDAVAQQPAHPLTLSMRSWRILTCWSLGNSEMLPSTRSHWPGQPEPGTVQDAVRGRAQPGEQAPGPVPDEGLNRGAWPDRVDVDGDREAVEQFLAWTDTE